ncbi:MAG TPA: UpxY family transcription antiterminator [Bryobacteraceae bacterium]|nr:UpxY family transcription antiterminator [Bryobacteraceae bacterium]
MAVACPSALVTEASLAWYAVRVRSNFEWAVSTALTNKDYEAFLPTYRTRRRWSDRVKEIEAPLFRGYTFCRFDAAQRLPILTTPGVVSIVGSATGPIPVDEWEIASVRGMVASGAVIGPWPFLREGQYVAVEHGPLSGVEGIIVSFKGQYRLVVSVSLLQRSVAVEIDRNWVRPTSDHRR